MLLVVTLWLLWVPDPVVSIEIPFWLLMFSGFIETVVVLDLVVLSESALSLAVVVVCCWTEVLDVTGTLPLASDKFSGFSTDDETLSPSVLVRPSLDAESVWDTSPLSLDKAFCQSDGSSSSNAESTGAERMVSWPPAQSRWLRTWLRGRAAGRRERGRLSGRPGRRFGGRAVTRDSRVALRLPLLEAAAAETG